MIKLPTAPRTESYAIDDDDHYHDDDDDEDDDDDDDDDPTTTTMTMIRMIRMRMIKLPPWTLRLPSV